VQIDPAVTARVSAATAQRVLVTNDQTVTVFPVMAHVVTVKAVPANPVATAQPTKTVLLAQTVKIALAMVTVHNAVIAPPMATVLSALNVPVMEHAMVRNAMSVPDTESVPVHHEGTVLRDPIVPTVLPRSVLPMAIAMLAQNAAAMVAGHLARSVHVAIVQAARHMVIVLNVADVPNAANVPMVTVPSVHKIALHTESAQSVPATAIVEVAPTALVLRVLVLETLVIAMIVAHALKSQNLLKNRGWLANCVWFARITTIHGLMMMSQTRCSIKLPVMSSRL
jgi:hypothetical protein